METPRGLRRLLRVREIEEEQAHSALKLAVAEVGHLEAARAGLSERERAGRRLVAESARSGEVVDRVAGIEETRLARAAASALKTRIAAAEKEAAARREAYLAKRVERRQTEALVEAAEARAAAEAGRRGQQAVDEWFLNRQERRRLEQERLERERRR